MGSPPVDQEGELEAVAGLGLLVDGGGVEVLIVALPAKNS